MFADARATALAAEASNAYERLKRNAESKVVRWEWATFARHSYEPAYFELHRWPRGKLLPSEPDPPMEGAHGYGFDAEGRVVVERQQTEFPGRVYETFYRHEADGIAAFAYHHDPEKPWINVQWLVLGPPGVTAIHGVYAQTGGSSSQLYTYEPEGRLAACEQHGTSVDGSVLVYEFEHDLRGKIVRIYSRDADGSRSLVFGRPTKRETFAANRRALLDGLTDAVLEALRSLRVEEPVYALVLHHCEGDGEHRLPPGVAVGLESERLLFLGDDDDDGARERVWDPREWTLGNVDMPLGPELRGVCELANQDISQNDREGEAHVLFLDIARALRARSLPFETTLDFVVVVLDLDESSFASQVAGQIDAGTARPSRLSRSPRRPSKRPRVEGAEPVRVLRPVDESRRNDVMRVYQPRRKVDHELCSTADPLVFLAALAAIPTTANVSSADLLPPFEIVRGDDWGKTFAYSDCPWYLGNVLILTPRAVERVGPFLRERGQLIPTKCEGSELFVFRITNYVDALSEETQASRFDDGSLMVVHKWVFKPDPLRGVEMFAVPGFRIGGPVFVQKEFRKLWKESGLAGLAFDLVWKYEPA